MLLRHAATRKLGDWTNSKEELALVGTLAPVAGGIDAATAAKLEGLTGVAGRTAALLVGLVRGNAAAVFRGGHRVACALSVRVGYARPAPKISRGEMSAFV